MRRTATVRWMEAVEARRFRLMALEMPAQPIEQRRLPLAALITMLRSLVRPDITDWRPARTATRSPA
jgi:hypothetical protein